MIIHYVKRPVLFNEVEEAHWSCRVGESNIDLYHGDCLEKMKLLPNESVDLVLSDIPYGISFNSWDIKHDNKNTALLGSSPAQKGLSIFKRRGKPKNGWSKADRKIPVEFQKFCEGFLAECLRVLKPAGAIICFTGRQFQHRFTVAAEEVGLIYKDTLTWNKCKAPYKAQRIEKVLSRRGVESDTAHFRLGNLAPISEPIVWLMKPYPIGTTITDCFLQYGTGCFNDKHYTKNLISHNSFIKDKLHETQKPLLLLERLIETFSIKGHTVLDMFMGSGTTGLACINTQRDFIGIDLSEKHVASTKQRIRKFEIMGQE